MRPVDKLNILTDHLKHQEKPPKYLENWLTDCLNRWQAGADLHEAFCIYDNAGERMRRRNALLWQHHELNGLAEWQTAKQISKQLKTGNLSPIIDAANKIYPIPKTTTRIYDLLKLNAI